MESDGSNSSDLQERVDEVVAAYLGAVEAGQAPDRQALLARHPDLAGELTLFFADSDHAESWARPLRALAPSERSPLAGRSKFGRFELLGTVGFGAFGTVYKARDPDLDREVAIKVPRAGHLAGAEDLDRFLREGRSLAQLHHPGIVPVYEVGQADGLPYLVQQFMPGRTLAELLTVRRLTAEEAARMLIQVADGLQYAHEHGVIHRDLKPSNILLAGDGTPHLLDFGLARWEGVDTTMTLEGQVLGTPAYMSPEQAVGRAHNADAKSDVYSLGVVLYQLLTGEVPFRGNARMLLQHILHDEPRAPRSLNDCLPRNLETICLKCLRKEPHLRYASARALAEDLRRFLAGQPIQARPTGVGERSWRWCRRNSGWAAMIGSVALLLLVIAVGASVLSWQRSLALNRALAAERRTEEELFASLVAQARARSLSRRPGQRFESLELVARATELAREREWLPGKMLELRNAALAALAMPDLYPARNWPSPTSSDLQVDFDDTFTLYARTDLEGNCSIRRVGNDQEVHRLRGPDAPKKGDLPYPILSRDGRFVAVLYEKGPVKVWRLNQDEPMAMLAEKDVWRVYFHPDSRLAALAHLDGVISLYDLTTGTKVTTLPRDRSPNAPWRELTLALHPSEPLIAVSSHFAKEVHVRDLHTGKLVHKALDMALGCSCVAWHPQGHLLAMTDGEGHGIHLYERATFRQVRTLAADARGTAVFFNHSGDLLAAKGWGGTMLLFDVATGQLLFQLPGAWPTHHLRFGRDGDWLAADRREGRLSLWQVSNGQEYRRLAPVPLPGEPDYYMLAVHPRGRLLAVNIASGPSQSTGIGLWDLATGDHLAFLPDLGIRALSFEAEPSGALLTIGVYGVFRWPVRIDDAQGAVTIGPPQRLPLPPGDALGASRDSRVLASADRAVNPSQPHAGVWVLHQGQPPSVLHLAAKEDIGSVAVHPEGRRAVSAGHAGGAVKVWDLKDGRPPLQLTDQGSYPQFSPDGRWLAVGGGAGRLYSVDSWETKLRFHGRAVFSPDSQLLAVNDWDHVIRLVDIDSGHELARLEDPNLEVPNDICFTPDRSRLITTTNGNSRGVHVWDLATLRARLKERELDWQAPDSPPATKAAAPLRVQVLGAEAFPLATRAYQHVAKERPESAAADLEEALALMPQLDWACGQLARLHVLGPKPLRKAEQAVALAERARRICPHDVTYRSTLGMAYYRAGRWQAARDILETSVRDSLEWRAAYDLFFLAMCHQRLGDASKAKGCYGRASNWLQEWQSRLPSDWNAELRELQAEAAAVLGVP